MAADRNWREVAPAIFPGGSYGNGGAMRDAPIGGFFAAAVSLLGTGSAVSAQDTVPYCLWRAAHHLDNFEEALWQTAAGYGDVDTTCAIVGGIVALSVGKLPADWLTRREPLPALAGQPPSD